MMAGAKGTKRSVSRIDDSDEDGPILTKPIKKTKTTASATSASAGKDKDGNPYWELSSKRRIGISKFKDMTMINIREYYQKDDDMLPGKKVSPPPLPFHPLFSVPPLNPIPLNSPLADMSSRAFLSRCPNSRPSSRQRPPSVPSFATWVTMSRTPRMRAARLRAKTPLRSPGSQRHRSKRRTISRLRATRRRIDKRAQIQSWWGV